VKRRRALLIGAVLFCFVAARHRAALPPAREPAADVFSASNPRSVEATHLSLDLSVDFDAQILRGSVTHTLLNHAGTHHGVKVMLND
jgi:hypothetical protein